MEIVSKPEARARELKRYFTGRPCKNGHTAERYTSNSACVTCLADKFREWRADPENRKKHSLGSRVWEANNPEASLIYAARSRARRLGIACTIGPGDIRIPDRCPVLGIPLGTAHGGGKGNGPTSPSLDRIDPSKGYTPGNTRVISWRANKLKSNATVGEVERILAYMRAAVAVPVEDRVGSTHDSPAACVSRPTPADVTG